MILHLTTFQIASILVISTCFIIFILIFKYQKNKTLEISKLKYLFLELKKEKVVSENLKNSSFKIQEIENKTQLQLNKLKVSVLNINFSLTELMN